MLPSFIIAACALTLLRSRKDLEKNTNISRDKNAYQSSKRETWSNAIVMLLQSSLNTIWKSHLPYINEYILQVMLPLSGKKRCENLTTYPGSSLTIGNVALCQ